MPRSSRKSSRRRRSRRRSRHSKKRYRAAATLNDLTSTRALGYMQNLNPPIIGRNAPPGGGDPVVPGNPPIPPGGVGTYDKQNAENMYDANFANITNRANNITLNADAINRDVINIENGNATAHFLAPGAGAFAAMNSMGAMDRQAAEDLIGKMKSSFSRYHRLRNVYGYKQFTRDALQEFDQMGGGNDV